MNTLETILAKHAEAAPTITAMQTYSLELFNLSVKYIEEKVLESGAELFKRTLVAVLDPTKTPRSTDAALEALKSQWPGAKLEVVHDVNSNQFYVFAV